jgi:peroxiredoxin
MTTPPSSLLRQPLPTGPDLARRRVVLATAAALSVPMGLVACARREPAPAFEYTLLDGTRQASTALRGQVVLVNFWATSCAVCVKEMPQFAALHQALAGRGLQTLAVAMQHDAPAMVAEFAQRRALPFGVVIDNTGAIARAFGGVRATPTTLLIDRSHFEVWRHEGEPNFVALQERIGQLLEARA